MLLPAFDTATPAVTAGAHGGERVLAEVTTVDVGLLLLPAQPLCLRRPGARGPGPPKRVSPS